MRWCLITPGRRERYKSPRRAHLRRKLGHGLRALGDGVLRQLAGEDKADSSLDLPRREGRLLVVAGQAAGLSGHAVEQVIDEGVHHAHRLLGDAGL